MKQKILIVEDELPIITLLKYNLEQAGFQTDVAYDGEEAIQKATANTYDLILLDVMLPKRSGIEVCVTLRKQDAALPILLVTAKSEIDDITEGLYLGADDYITKPFSPKELIARIHAVLRRKQVTSVEEQKLAVGEIEVFPEKFEAYLKGEILQLTKKEFELLAYFLQNKGVILSRDQLLNAVWNYDFSGDTRIVDVHVAKLREKIEEDNKNPQYIKTVHGFGYKMSDL